MKTFELEYLLEPIAEQFGFYTKRMFGGLAVYLDDKMVLVLMEDKQTKEYRGVSYPYAIWNGLMVPTERSEHESLMADYSSLVPHVVLGKWLFLSLEDNEFEDQSERIVDAIKARDPRFGIQVEDRRKSKKKKTARFIRSLRNLGPKTEEDLISVGYETVQQLLDAGWEEAYCRLVLAYPQRNNLNMLKALMGACLDMDWRHLDARDEAEAQKWVMYFKV